MASRHHPNHHCHPYPASCCCFYTTTGHCYSDAHTITCHPSPPLPASATDPLLQSLAVHLLRSTHHFPPPPPPQCHQYQDHHQRQNLPQPKPYHSQHEKDSSEEQAYIDSLVQRIAALETSLAAPPPQQPAVHQKATPAIRRSNRVSLREIAARTIQTQFRLYLVRRSRTLRHLRDLAAIRSHFADLKSLAPSASVCQRAMDLLLHLDSIQSRDQMVREGKRSIYVELVRFLEVAYDGVALARRGHSQASSVGKTGPLRLQQHSKPPVNSVAFAGGGRKVPTSSRAPPDSVEEEQEEVIYESGSSRVSEDDGVGGQDHGNDDKASNAELEYANGRDDGNVGGGGPALSSRKQQRWIPQLGLYAPLPVQMESMAN